MSLKAQQQPTTSLFVVAVLAAFGAAMLLPGCSGGEELPDLSMEEAKKGKSFGESSGSVPDVEGEENLGSANVGPSVKLENITKSTGIDFIYRNGAESNHASILESLGGGVGVLDFDLDGMIDVFFPGGGHYREKNILGYPGKLFRNNGDLTFQDVTTVTQTGGDSMYSHACQVGDFDNDGFQDFIVTGYGAVMLYHNQGDGTFLEVSKEVGIDTTSWSSSAGWGDFNGDSHLDLYLCNYVNWSFENHPFCEGPLEGQIEICPPKSFEGLQDRIYYNNGDGTFTNMVEELGLVDDGTGKGLGVLLTDIEPDGDLDIYVCNDTTRNHLYVNDGTGKFKENALLHSLAFDGLGGANGSMGVDVADYNHDGRPDIWVANYEHEAFALYENIGDGMFLHVSDKSGVTSLGGVFVGFGTVFYDLDLDGDDDILVTNGHVINYPPSGRLNQRPLVLINENGRYIRKRFPVENYISQPHRGRGLAYADLDQDGDADFIFSNSREISAIIKNDSVNDNSYVRIQLVGSQSNRDAIGAIAVLHTSAGDRHKYISGGTSYLSQSEFRLHWGVAKGTEVTGMTIKWPSGLEQKIDQVAINDTTIILEPISE